MGIFPLDRHTYDARRAESDVSARRFAAVQRSVWRYGAHKRHIRSRFSPKGGAARKFSIGCAGIARILAHFLICMYHNNVRQLVFGAMYSEERSYNSVTQTGYRITFLRLFRSLCICILMHILFECELQALRIASNAASYMMGAIFSIFKSDERMCGTFKNEQRVCAYQNRALLCACHAARHTCSAVHADGICFGALFAD